MGRLPPSQSNNADLAVSAVNLAASIATEDYKSRPITALEKKLVKTPDHLVWLRDTGQRVTVASGHGVELWALEPTRDPTILSAWARHFRQQYIDDDDLRQMVQGTGMTIANYVRDVLFPDAKVTPGPSVRSGDFAEILVADYLEFVLGYWCPRDRYKGRFNRNDSTKGADIIGFRFAQDGQDHPNDELFVVEAKAGMSPTQSNRLQDAVVDSFKDALREAMTLNALKQRMLDKGEMANVIRIQRFQNESDRPFQRYNGAAAVLDSSVLAATDLSAADGSTHGNSARLRLIVIHGEALMTLVHAIYDRAASEA